MLTVDVLSTRIGLSVWQTRRLVYALRPLLQGFLYSKPGQALQIKPDAIGIIECGASLKASGVTLKGLAATLQRELDDTKGKPRLEESPPALQDSALGSANARAKVEALTFKVELLEKRVNELENDRDAWQKLALNLQEQLAESVNDFETLAG